MDIASLKARLLEKERELVADTTRLDQEARVSGEEEVRDYTDEATSSEEESETLHEEAVASQTLSQVQDALRRIEDGTYGLCVSCGRPLEEARLEAIPWAAYCTKDQEKLDRAAHVPQGGATL